TCAGFRLRARFRATAVTAFARRGRWNFDLHLLAAIGIFERNFEIIAQIRAARSPGAAGAAAHEIAKKIFENIAETARAAKSAGSAAAIFESGMAILVIGAAFMRVLEGLICFIDLLASGSLFRLVRVSAWT